KTWIRACHNLFSVSLPFTALFTVEAEQDSYYAELHSEIKMACRFSRMQSSELLTVIWQRIVPTPIEDVYRLERGLENNNFTNERFRGRAQLVKEDLLKFRAVLELSQLQLNDSGMYRCIVKHQDVDYKQTKLTIWAPYTSVKKNIRRTGTEEVELSCQSQGFPLAKVIWRDGRLQSLMQGSRSTNETTSEGTWNITSRVTVHTNVISNYTCSFESENRDSQEATFLIVIVAVTSLVLHRRRKGWLSWFLVLTFTLFCVSRTAYGVLCMEIINKIIFVLCRENQCVDIWAVLPEVGKTVLLEGEKGTGKTSVANWLASSWADSLGPDPLTSHLTIRQLLLVILVDFEEAKGDFFQVVKSRLPAEVGLETGDIREILQGPLDSLLILDSYKQGDREADESLVKFLKGRNACRVLVTACPGEHSALGETVRKELREISLHYTYEVKTLS
uniref:Si:ch211-241b2.5 n=1 Tax=Electrophorus electricus TaxID=8005 RepID=A0A4W4DW41_ELEEL